MKIKNGFVLREVAGQAVVIATGDASKTFHGMVKLNSTAKEIWQWLEEGNDLSSIVDLIVKKYNVDKADAAADVAEFADKMEKAGFLEL